MVAFGKLLIRKAHPRGVLTRDSRAIRSGKRHEANKEWIVVKAVCDWADGTKKTTRDNYHPLAAAASLSLVKFVISLPNAFSDLGLKRPSLGIQESRNVEQV